MPTLRAYLSFFFCTHVYLPTGDIDLSSIDDIVGNDSTLSAVSCLSFLVYYMTRLAFLWSESMVNIQQLESK